MSYSTYGPADAEGKRATELYPRRMQLIGKIRRDVEHARAKGFRKFCQLAGEHATAGNRGHVVAGKCHQIRQRHWCRPIRDEKGLGANHRKHGERCGYSMLANLGVMQTVATSGSQYVEIAVRLATDAVFMTEVRASIRAGLEHSSLTDMVAHTRNLERAYLSALEQRCPAALPKLDD